jgi:phage terminase large subunit-like protein
VLGEDQNWLAKGRMCMVLIFIISQLTERSREWNLTMQFAFPVYEKTFDKATTNKVWQVMTDQGFPQELIRVIQNVYRDIEV